MPKGVRVHGKGIQIDFRYRGVRCREHIKVKPTAANLKYAANLRATVLTEIAQGVFSYRERFPDSPRASIWDDSKTTRVSVGRALDDWLKGASAHLAASTIKEYRKAISGRLKPVFGSIHLRDLKTATVKNWIAEQSVQGVSGKTLNNLLIPLRQTCGDAFADGMIERDPMARIKALPVIPPEPDPFTPGEVLDILDHLQGQSRNLYQFQFAAGLRPSETIALTWRDIDFRSRKVRVRRAKTRGVEKTTKTRAGTRDVHLFEAAVEALEAQKPFTYLADREVFHNPRTDAPWASEKAMREVDWTHALKRAGVAYRPPYQCRHTYASTLLAAGENPLWVAQQMGHANPIVLYQRYARWIPDAMPSAGEKAGEMVTLQSRRSGKVDAND